MKRLFLLLAVATLVASCTNTAKPEATKSEPTPATQPAEQPTKKLITIEEPKQKPIELKRIGWNSEYDTFLDDDHSLTTLHPLYGDVEKVVVKKNHSTEAIYHFNEVGNVSKIESGQSVTIYKYDDDGRLLEKVEHNKSKDIYQHNTKTNKTVSYWCDEKGRTYKEYPTTYSYNPEGLLIEMANVIEECGDVERWRYTYKYNYDGKITEQRIYWNGSHFCRYSYNYNAQGHMIEKIKHDDTSYSDFCPRGKWTYTYDSKGRKIIAYYRSNDNNNFRIDYKYDSRWNVIEVDYDNWQGETQYEITYRK